MTKLILIIIAIVAVITIVHAQTALDFFVTDKIVCQKAVGDIVFYIDGVERVRLCEEGDFLVYGNKFANDKELYDGFRAWLIENKGHLKVVR